MTNRDTQSRASSVRPLLEGDRIGDRQVRGFAWKAPNSGQRPSHRDDKLLLDGDELLAVPPDRPVPQSSDGAVALAQMPPGDLGLGRVLSAASFDPAIATRVDGLLDLPGSAWHPLMRPLFAAVHATGHRAWLSGGAVRDVVSGVPLEKVNDLDLSGTAPTGRFADITYQALRAVGLSECAVKVSPTNLVCSVVRPGSRLRMIEYRGLSCGGFPYPAVGSRLEEDSRHRDYSFNALLYDVLEHEVFDPSGYGLEDLCGPVRRFRPLRQNGDALGSAMVVLRAMKLHLRWQDTTDLDLGFVTDWLEVLPMGLWQSLTDLNWAVLRKYRKEEILEPVSRQWAFAEKLPESGRTLVTTLIGGDV
jgi:poly(A) polymerase